MQLCVQSSKIFSLQQAIMSNFSESKDLYSTIFTVLKNLGVKVPKIKNFKSSLPEQDKIAQQSDTQMFGVSLFKQEWTYESGYALPKFLALTTAYLEKFSRTLGLFRKSGSIARQRNLRIKLSNEESLEGSDPNDVASLLKQWLRELPEPLIPCVLHDLFVRCQHLDSEDCVTATLLSCLLLPPEHLHSLKHLLCFLKNVASYKSDNKMREHNLAIIMAPNIFTSKIENVFKTCNSLVELHTSVIELLIKNADRVGEVPQSVLLHYPNFGEKRVSEQSSADSGPSKLSRKCRTKPVKGLFSGIWKLVGQNAITAINLKTSTPKTTWTPSNISYRQKSNSTSCQMKRDLAISRSSSFNSNISAGKMNSAFKVTASPNESARKSSAVQFEYDELNYENVSMRSSECNLAVNSKELFNFFTPTSPYCPQDDSYETLYWSPSSKNIETEQSETLPSKSLYENVEYLRKSETTNKSEGLAIKPDHFNTLKMLSPNPNLINSSSYDQICNSNNCVDLYQSKYCSAGTKWKDEGKGASNLNAKVTKKPARNSSLIRGKPNTVGSGLPCQSLNKNPISLQSSEINNNEKIINDKDNNPISMEIKTNVSEKENEVLFSEQDISLIFNFANFNLSSLNADDTPERNEESSVISVPKKSPLSNENESYAITLGNRPAHLKNVSNHSYCKIPRLPCSLGTHPKHSSEISLDRRIKPPKLRLSNSEISTGIPVLSKTQLQLSDLETSLNDSCFLTPNNKPVRKSIAEILKRSGYVSEKVQIYESKSCSIPSENDNRRVSLLKKSPLRSFSQKQLFSTESNHKTLSVSQSCDASISKRISNNERISNRICTPVKLPHRSYKCSINLGTISSHTSHSLKKVTNINCGGKQTTDNDNNPVQDGNNSQNPIASSQQKSYNTDLRMTKPRRNTFSSRNPPPKFLKRVSRSESSPSCLRPTNRLFKLIQESTFSNPNVPLEMNNVLNSSFSPTDSFPYKHLKKSGSSLSIQKLRSNEMIDEWQCEL